MVQEYRETRVAIEFRQGAYRRMAIIKDPLFYFVCLDNLRDVLVSWSFLILMLLTGATCHHSTCHCNNDVCEHENASM